MSLFSVIGTALSVVSTIGKVAGSLSQVLPGSDGDQNETAEDKFVEFGMRSSDNSEPSLGQVVFWRDDESKEIFAINQSFSSKADIFFPGYEGAAAGAKAGSTVTLPCQTKMRMGLFFKNYADFDLDTMIVTPAKDKTSSRSISAASHQARSENKGRTDAVDDGTDDPNVSLQSSGNNVPSFPTDTTFTFKLGPSIEITAQDTTIRIVVLGGYLLAGLILLNIRGAGSTAAHLVNVINEGYKGGSTSGADADAAPTKDSQTAMTVKMPAGLNLSRGIQSIDLTLAVRDSSSAARMEAGMNQCEDLTDKDLRRLTHLAFSRATRA